MHKSWFSNAPVHDGRLNLICFPFAGGGSSTFSHWKRTLPSWINVCPVMLPGRESRYKEARYADFATLAQTLADVVLPAVAGSPYALYGHSMGAWLAHSVGVAGSLQGHLPTCLCIGAQRAPQMPYPFPSCDAMTDEELLSFMVAFGGIDAQLLINQEWVQWMLPLIRDDLKLCESHPVRHDHKLECPIYAFGGKSDQLISQDLILEWRHQTHRAFESTFMSGGHFFIRTEAVEFLTHLGQKLHVHKSVTYAEQYRSAV